MPAPARSSRLPRCAAAALAAALSGEDAKACPLSAARQAPVAASIARSFGFALRPLLGTAVLRTDIAYATRAGMPVRAAGDGRVTAVAPSGRGGSFVSIAQAEAVHLRYGPLAPRIRAGACVTAGDRLGSTLRPPLTLRMWRAEGFADPLRWLSGRRPGAPPTGMQDDTPN
ncbi:M23 family metallopeptidase [Methylobacterium aquaticum]|uniref:M23ase beta-sheet core domain-containing protein n=1 Tax=Methylobacterium aquaticum TaxID=270351 RepID=A0A0J6S0F8_9HYPH|nr:M23 family metallopeptidase [Methylobacterium aquaticum]KMO27038.1 hypothetical protein VP06_32025 [Methylobacterium aquaticum]